VAATGSVPARGRRHPITVVTRARELARGGWGPEEIVRLLARDGVTVDARSVRRWTDAKVQRAYERHERERQARRAKAAGTRHATPEYKLARMRALREHVSLKDAQIARLMRHDFGDEISRDMVAHALATGRYPQSLR
jgi:hypothetical protein